MFDMPSDAALKAMARAWGPSADFVMRVGSNRTKRLRKKRQKARVTFARVHALYAFEMLPLPELPLEALKLVIDAAVASVAQHMEAAVVGMLPPLLSMHVPAADDVRHAE